MLIKEFDFGRQKMALEIKYFGGSARPIEVIVGERKILELIKKIGDIRVAMDVVGREVDNSVGLARVEELYGAVVLLSKKELELMEEVGEGSCTKDLPVIRCERLTPINQQIGELKMAWNTINELVGEEGDETLASALFYLEQKRRALVGRWLKASGLFDNREEINRLEKWGYGAKK